MVGSFPATFALIAVLYVCQQKPKLCVYIYIVTVSAEKTYTMLIVAVSFILCIRVDDYPSSYRFSMQHTSKGLQCTFTLRCSVSVQVKVQNYQRVRMQVQLA